MWGDLTEWGNFEDPDADWSIILNWMFKKWDGEAWAGFIWLRIWTGDMPL